MKKHKKTRKEKIIADLHRKIQLQKQVENKPQEYSFTQKVSINPAPITFAPIPRNTYPMLFSDLQKTAMLTGFIIVAELIFFFFLKNRIIVLPNLSF